jgi:hypothetical protein
VMPVARGGTRTGSSPPVRVASTSTAAGSKVPAPTTAK